MKHHYYKNSIEVEISKAILNVIALTLSWPLVGYIATFFSFSFLCNLL